MFSFKLIQKGLEEEKEYDLIIIGAGPAGLAAGVYGGRSGLKVAILDVGLAGGQMLTADIIENWPGEKRVKAPDLAKKFKDHAAQYADLYELTQVIDVKKEGSKFIIETSSGKFKSKAIILATGSKRRKLNVPGEDKFSGKGVSYCAVCDGPFFKGKRVAVIGGGNTAVSDAIYLKSIGVDVILVHRRREFRADKVLVERALSMGIRTKVPYVVEEILGEDKVEGIKIRNRDTNDIEYLKVDGVFVAIGMVPNTQLAMKLGVETDQYGFIIVDRSMRTNVPFVYAAGDVTGGVLQVVVAAAEGAIAALSAHEDLSRNL